MIYTWSHVIDHSSPPTRSSLSLSLLLMCFLTPRLSLLVSLFGVKVPADPVKNPHARKIRDEPFYREWLLPRARFYNAQR